MRLLSHFRLAGKRPRRRPDDRDVLRAAAILDITEYDLFRLAYVRWHGRFPEEDVMEPIFVAYMFEARTPPWARHFARHVCEQDRAGVLDRHALGVQRLPGSRAMVRRGMRLAVTMVSALLVLFVIAEFSARVMGLGERCMFPPCY